MLVSISFDPLVANENYLVDFFNLFAHDLAAQKKLNWIKVAWVIFCSYIENTD